MKPGIVVLSVSLLFAAAVEDLSAQRAGTPEKRALTPGAAAVAALDEGWAAAHHRISVALGKAASEKEREQVIAGMPDRRKYCRRAWKIISRYPDDPGRVMSLAWIATHSRTAEEILRAGEALLADHPSSPEMAQALSGFNFVPPSERLERLLRAVIERSTLRAARGEATYLLSGVLFGLATTGKANAAVRRAEAERLLETIIHEYADVPHVRFGTLGKAAGNRLFELRHLVVGKVVPEIEGEDESGVPFKLSDYRGQVVLIDFWGHW